MRTVSHPQRSTQRAYIAIGANLRDPLAQVRDALEEIATLAQTSLRRTSSFYRSAALGYTAQPEFVNAVCEIDTSLTPRQLLDALLAIEHQHGRERSFANAPRTLDLDILLYADRVINEPGLMVPHPRMLQRAFVVRPLAEIDASIQIPGNGCIAGHLASVAGQDIAKIESGGS